MDFEAVVEEVATGLSTSGIVVLEYPFPTGLVHCLKARARELEIGRSLRRAGVGRHSARHLNKGIRSDEISWLSADCPVEAHYLDCMESIRLGLNRRLFLGLFDYECHFAVYQPGAYYRRHLDAFQGQRNRVVTTVVYLNANWQFNDGGELLVYGGNEAAIPDRTILPTEGKLVVFVSERFPHEVLAAERTRYSIAGWFRLNGSGSGRIDTFS